MFAAYRTRFSAEPRVCVRAPGRVNLIGEHVDYNGGTVMPIAIDLATYAIAGRRNGEVVRIFSTHADDEVRINLTEPGSPLAGWGAYAQGVIVGLQQLGIDLPGANLLLDGDLTPGAGLASSAALEASIALALLHLSAASLPREKLAELCRTAEHDYANVPCGIMDPWACLMSRDAHAMLLDCREGHETALYIPWPDGDTVVLVIDSRSPHRLSAGGYARRVRECEMAFEHIMGYGRNEPGHGIRTLADVSMAQLKRATVNMEQPLDRRAHHVISEIARAKDAAKALSTADFETFGQQMNDSHRSLALDYEVSSPRMDELAAIVRAVPGVFGARMTGGGFGGCVVALAPTPAIPRVDSAVRSTYDQKYGVTARIRATRPREGASITPIGN